MISPPKYRVLFLGNSHVAALYQGWLEIAPEFKGINPSFFAANSSLFNSLEMSENRVFGVHDPKLYSRKNLRFLDQVFGERRIDLKMFDQIVVVGRSSHEVDFLSQFERFSIDGVGDGETGRDGPKGNVPYLSQAAFDAFCIEIAHKRLPDPCWWNWTAPKVAFLPPPVPRADCPETDDRYGAWARFGANPGIDLAFLKLYRAHVARLYANHGITLLSPPDEVYDPCGLTRAEFGDDPERLHPRAGAFDSDDFHHMNTRYGVIVLRDILQTLQTSGQGAAP